MMKKIPRNIWKILFGVYIIFVLYMMFFALGRGHWPGYSFNLIPFKTILNYTVKITLLPRQGLWLWFINVFANIVFFMPFGIFTRILSQNKLKSSQFLLFFLVFITVLEILQMLFRVGTCDVDDIILNTLGAGLGFILMRACPNSK